MSAVQEEILALEERLRLAELEPDSAFFEEVLDENVVLVDEKGRPFLAKMKVVDAHRPGKGPKFTRVEMSEMEVTEHGTTAVVTCTGAFEGASKVTLKFMRIWQKKNGRWKIIAGSVSEARHA
jgi:ketosteroid isomerase-like protein